MQLSYLICQSVLYLINWNEQSCLFKSAFQTETVVFQDDLWFICTGLFISPSGISELDCATTKTRQKGEYQWIENLSKFFLYVPPLPRDLPQLRQRIMEAAAAIDRQMLQRVSQELDYRIDICRVTKGAHIEQL